MSKLSELMKTEKLFFDGAMGTLLIDYPEYSGKEPALLNLTHPEIIIDIHKKYVDIGCNLITTNTFDVNPEKYDNYAEIVQVGDNDYEVHYKGGELTRGDHKFKWNKEKKIFEYSFKDSLKSNSLTILSEAILKELLFNI